MVFRLSVTSLVVTFLAYFCGPLWVLAGFILLIGCPVVYSAYVNSTSFVPLAPTSPSVPPPPPEE